MIVITGGAGFIGSALLWRLNAEGIDDIIVVDNFASGEKWQNLAKRRFHLALHKDEFLPWLKEKSSSYALQAIFHLGACSATSEKNMNYLLSNNVHYSMELFNFCREHSLPFIYASSAATYGAGELGYEDRHDLAQQLRPLNPYGFSKKIFDMWVLQQKVAPPFWAGLKFFNVFGPGEYHKEDMRSLVCKAVPQIVEQGKLKLFKSYKAGFADGEQQRDFVYIKDVVEVLWHLFSASNQSGSKLSSGLYNVGSGKARSFFDLGRAVFAAMKKNVEVEWVDMPSSIRDGYQYFTEAELWRLRQEARYKKPFTSLEEAVSDYVEGYLLKNDRYL